MTISQHLTEAQLLLEQADYLVSIACRDAARIKIADARKIVAEQARRTRSDRADRDDPNFDETKP